jgi:uncharacterized protein
MSPIQSFGSPSGPAATLEMSWDLFGELCRALAVRVANSGFDPDLVVGIAKAGVIPGAVVASMLRCDFTSMKISRREGTEVVSDRPRVLSEAPRQATGKRILIVDEICSSGDTLRLALNAVRNVRPEEVRTATSFVRVNGFKPDYFALETDGTIVFPWDRQVVDDEGELMLNPQYVGLV